MKNSEIHIILESENKSVSTRKEKVMKIGVVSRSFPEMTQYEAAEFMKNNGFTHTELCMNGPDHKIWNYNGISDIESVGKDEFMAIVNNYRASGIEVTALGVFTNLLEEDDEKRNANLESFYRHIEYAAMAGIPYVSTECGFDPSSRGVRADLYESRFDRLKDSLAKILAYCEKYDIAVALEPCVIDVVPSAKRMSDLIEQLGSDRLKVLLDPANLIANSSEEDMFYYLSEHVAYFHGKDRKVNDAKGRVVGDGDIMWSTFLSLYHEHCEGKPFILEYVNKDNCVEIKNRVEEYEKIAQKMM